MRVTRFSCWTIGAMLQLGSLHAAPKAGDEVSKGALAKLDEHGFVVLDQDLREGFSAYIGGRRPPFVTSDSVLMAFGRILEEYVAQHELAQFAMHHKLCEQLWEKFPEAPSDPAGENGRAGWSRARLFVGTAYRLLKGRVPAGLEDEELRLVEGEAARVEAGEGMRPPEWLDDAEGEALFLPYSSFKPTDPTYSSVPALARYWRWRKWLQQVPLGTSSPVDLAALRELELAVDGVGYLVADACAKGALFESGEPGLFKEMRRGNFSDREGKRRVFFEPTSPAEWGPLPVLAERGELGMLPLLVGADLGSVLAEVLIPDQSRDAVPEIEWEAGQKGQYISVLAALLEPLDRRAPGVFRSEAWQRKQLNAALGSWTEFRYANRLGTKQEAFYLSATIQEAGFVEPVPTFYRRLGILAEQLAGQREYELREMPDANRARYVLRTQKLVELTPKIEDPEVLFGKPRTLLLALAKHNGDPVATKGMRSGEDVKRLGKALGNLVNSYWDGEPEAAAFFRSLPFSHRDELSPRLHSLAVLCHRLEAMAERQLAGLPWTEEDVDLLEGYGTHTARLMFYDGNSYVTPRDRSPRIVPYATVGEPGAAVQVFHAATARPRMMVIRYPGPGGKTVECQGAVYAYRDVVREATPSLREWRAECEKAPWPAWMVVVAE